VPATKAYDWDKAHGWESTNRGYQRGYQGKGFAPSARGIYPDRTDRRDDQFTVVG